MRLPRALAPWTPWLELYPEPLALSLGAWIERLAPAMGPLQLASRPSRGEPDGYRGLSRRGPYERLLATEWALAEGFPDEFLRRAAMGEHLFHELATIEPAGSRRSAALFDAGPGQLGSPRLVHLAALIVLAHRAAASGAAFCWGVLQQPQGELYEAVTPESVLRLIEGRSALEPLAEDLAAWQQRLQPAAAADDLWLIGGPGLRALAGAQAPSVLEVEDVLEPGRAAVLARVHRQGQPVREAELELPAPRERVQLLRDPFGAARARPLPDTARLEDGTGLMFAPSETRLMAALPGGGLIAFSVPGSAREASGRPRMYVPPEGETIQAAGWHRRKFVVVTAAAGKLVVHGLGPTDVHGYQRTEVPLSAEPSIYTPVPAEGRLRPCLLARHGGVDAVLTLDGANALFRVPLEPRKLPVRMETAVAAAVMSGHKSADLLYAVRVPRGSTQGVVPRYKAVLRYAGAGAERSSSALDEDAPLEACFGASQKSFGPELAAVRLSRETWRILELLRPLTSDVPAPADGQVIGVGRAEPGKGEAGLLVLESDRRTLSLQTDTGSSVLLRVAGEIASVCTAGRAPLVAYRTTEGALYVQDLHEQAVLLHVLSGTGA
jgi:hypothetical protein